jgi:putative tryptophan/tyrosine transport system substrate-binding protein
MTQGGHRSGWVANRPSYPLAELSQFDILRKRLSSGIVGLMRRRHLLTLLSGAVAWPLAARAQRPALPVIGLLDLGPSLDSAVLAEFQRGLGETGYAEHRNVEIEYRFADNRSDRLTELSADLVRRRVDVIVAFPAIAARAALAATQSIPIVFGIGGDPVADGLVKSLNRPDGNATGMSSLATTLASKRLGLLRALLPSARRIAILANSVTAAFTQDARSGALADAASIGVELETLYAATSQEIDAAFTEMARRQCDALLVSPTPFFTDRRVQLVTLTVRDRLPAIFPSRDFAQAGGLMSYQSSATNAGQFRLMGTYAGRLLKGEKPADLPVVLPTKFDFTVNLRTAMALGINVPDTLLALADEVIE